MADRPFPTDVYLDTSFVVAAIIAGAKEHQACSAFSSRLADQGGRVYFSQILRLELSQAALNLVLNKRKLPKDIRDGYQWSQWRGNRMVRQQEPYFASTTAPLYTGHCSIFSAASQNIHS